MKTKNPACSYVPASLVRSPVFDKTRRLWGYELSCVGSYATAVSGFPEDDTVAVQVAASAYIGMQRIFARDKKFIINFNEKTILDNLPYAFPPGLAIVRVAENSYKHAGVPEMMQRLKSDGYRIAVAGSTNASPDIRPLYELADIISIEVGLATRQALEEMLSAVSYLNVELLATQVQTQELFKMCQGMGFSLFQGAFLKLPEIVGIRKLFSNPMARLSILHMMETDQPDLDKLAETIQADVVTSFRILSYLNSTAFDFTRKIESVHQAISLVPWSQIKRWLKVVLLNDVRQNSDSLELLILAAQRGKFLELIAKENDYWGFNPESLHLLGLLSVLDVMIGAPMSEIMNYLPLGNKLKDALCREPKNEYTPLLELALFVEEGRWAEAEGMFQRLNLDAAKGKAAFKAAVDWAEALTTLDETRD